MQELNEVGQKVVQYTSSVDDCHEEMLLPAQDPHFVLFGPPRDPAPLQFCHSNTPLITRATPTRPPT